MGMRCVTHSLSIKLKIPSPSVLDTFPLNHIRKIKMSIHIQCWQVWVGHLNSGNGFKVTFEFKRILKPCLGGMDILCCFPLINLASTGTPVQQPLGWNFPEFNATLEGGHSAGIPIIRKACLYLRL